MRVTKLINTLELCTTAICVQIRNDMKCTIFNFLLLVGVFNWGWIEGFKYNANLYNLKKNTSPKNAQTLYHREDCAKLRISCHAHIIYKTLDFVDLCSLIGAFSDPVSNVFLDLLEITIPTRGHTTIFEKIDNMAISHAGLWGSGGPWQTKK